MRLFRLFNRTICILRDTDGYFLRSKKTQEEWERQLDGIYSLSEKHLHDYLVAAHQNEAASGELNATKQVLHEKLEQMEKYRKMYADELQKRLELADRVRKMESRVVHARWVDLGPAGQREGLTMGRYGCTNCHYIQRRPLGSYVPFCEKCGAKMDGGDPA